MVFCAFVAAAALIPQGTLPKLIVPKGAAVKRNRKVEARSHAALMTAAQVREVVAADRTVKAVLPWTILSGATTRVAGKASLDLQNVPSVSGSNDDIYLSFLPSAQTGTIYVNLDEPSTGKTFVIVLYGSTYGPATMKYSTSSGSGELPVPDGSFRLPIAVVAAGPDSSSLTLEVKTRSQLLSIDTIQVFKVD